VNVGAADAGSENLDEHIVDANLGNVYIFEPKAGLAAGFDESFHNSNIATGAAAV
jgi:hypothetical protein